MAGDKINNLKFLPENYASDQTKTDTIGYLIANNINYTTKIQIAAIHIDAYKSESIILKNNLLLVENALLKNDGENNGRVLVDRK